MSGYARNQEIFQTSNSNDNENNLIATSSSGAQQTKRQCTENNDRESICWKYFEPFKVPRENGTVTKCTVPGCTASYIWCGATSNHVRHLKNKHEINIPLIKFIVSSGLPFNFVDTLKSAGFVNPNIELSTSEIIKEQINKAYNRLFLQLKLKAQQEKSTMFSIYEFKPDTRIDGYYAVTICNWLTKDFEFHKIQLFAKKSCSEIDDKSYDDDILDAFVKWELSNLKFYSDNGYEFFERLWDWDEKYQNFIQNLTRLPVNCFNKLKDLILRSEISSDLERGSKNEARCTSNKTLSPKHTGIDVRNDLRSSYSKSPLN
ncbi:7872_t:CDS:2 [Racocetra persica]|uniref:7872_t:CDS:1 n=1 Tax=Racocetra persica TaxID=160502 RepID=A0ACA9R4B1_9GLOM|nr:7872_t:CDS:2 [Racocetra persica]